MQAFFRSVLCKIADLHTLYVLEKLMLTGVKDLTEGVLEMSEDGI